MQLGIVREIQPDERRVAIIPNAVTQLIKNGFEVLISKDVGKQAFFSDSDYTDKGAELVDENSVYQSDLLVKVIAPSIDEVAKMKKGATLICLMEAYFNKDVIQKLAEGHINSYALEFIPRISRAQSMDVLSSMGSITGYRAVIEAANLAPKYFPLLMTAGGTVRPCKVFIIGAGVAGLMAIATAKRLGAVVEAYDTRVVVKEQVESLGAKFVEFDLESSDTEDSGGYATQQSKDFYLNQQRQMAEKLTNYDVVIATAVIPGKKAPVLITNEMLKGMKAGSLIVDIAAKNGGNVEGTKVNEIVSVHDVTLVGKTDYPSRSSVHASELFSNNVLKFIGLLVKDGALELKSDDEILKETIITYKGTVVHEKLKLIV